MSKELADRTGPESFMMCCKQATSKDHGFLYVDLEGPDSKSERYYEGWQRPIKIEGDSLSWLTGCTGVPTARYIPHICGTVVSHSECDRQLLFIYVLRFGCCHQL